MGKKKQKNPSDNNNNALITSLKEILQTYKGNGSTGHITTLEGLITDCAEINITKRYNELEKRRLILCAVYKCSYELNQKRKGTLFDYDSQALRLLIQFLNKELSITHELKNLSMSEKLTGKNTQYENNLDEITKELAKLTTTPKSRSHKPNDGCTRSQTESPAGPSCTLSASPSITVSPSQTASESNSVLSPQTQSQSPVKAEKNPAVSSNSLFAKKPNADSAPVKQSTCLMM